MAQTRGAAALDAHGALIYTMVMVSAAESSLSESELQLIGDIIGHLPVFYGFDRERLPVLLNRCAQSLAAETGLEGTLEAIKAALPVNLRETAYAIACDLVAADGEASQDELRLLELIRHRLDVDRLTAAAIERGARARFQRL
jgi:tellurite resistance protein